MTLDPATRLGAYEIDSLLGRGGMGEVYLARDTNLGREVAVKVLPRELASDGERLTRFEREARVLASLNHPTIATLHGFETASTDHDPETRFLIMELVRGETLAERLEKGPLSGESAVRVFLQIAEGLEAAHERGVVHRDLKPANIKLDPEGRVKILDFGLAKAMASEADQLQMHVDDSPTMTMEATMRGQIMGTAAYMAPEQARGESVDRRADVWAFGACLFEALTARGAFGGTTATDILAHVLRGEPEWHSLPAETSPRLVELLERCLEKDPKERLRDIGEARIALKKIQSGEEDAVVQAEQASPTRGWRTIALWSAASLLAGLLISGWAGRALAPAKVASTASPSRFTISVPEELPKVPIDALALSPDGRQLVYALGVGEAGRLVHRPLDRFDAESTVLPQTEGAQLPFFSSNGQSVGFFLGPGGRRTLSRVDLRTRAVRPLTDVAHAGFRAAWAPDDSLLVGNQRNGLMRLAPKGELPDLLVELDRAKNEAAHLHPEVLPGGAAAIFTVLRTGGELSLRLVDLATTTTRPLLDAGADARYSASGHLVYGHRGDLWAVRFDLDESEVQGEPQTIARGVRMTAHGTTAFALGGSGTLVYLTGTAEQARLYELTRVDRTGEVQAVLAVGDISDLRVSPDGRRLIGVQVGSQNGTLMFEGSGPAVRITHESSIWPVWTAEGEHLIASVPTESGDRLLHQLEASGALTSHLPLENLWPEGEAPTGDQMPFSVSPDGGEILVGERSSAPPANLDIVGLPLVSGGERRTFLATPFNESEAQIAPGGDLVAYVSDRDGHEQVFVTTYPEPGRRVKVSLGRARFPRWSLDSSELFYWDWQTRRLIAAQIEHGPEIRVLGREPLFGSDEFLPARGYDVAPDGGFYLMQIRSDREANVADTDRVHVVLDWPAELEGETR